jgi:rubrerythrin
MNAICPQCGSPKTMKIVYGYPTLDRFIAAKKGKVSLGGQAFSSGDPEWHCKTCGHEWREDELPAV